MVHAVDAGSIDAMSTGMRVAAQFLDERNGAVTDVYFVPEADARRPGHHRRATSRSTITEHLISLEIHEPLAPAPRAVHRGAARGQDHRSEVAGRRGKVYVPSRGYDALERVQMTEADDVEVADRGAVSSFTVITPVQYYGQEETEPYIRASILLDGTDSPIIGIDVRDIPLDELRVGHAGPAPSGEPRSERDARRRSTTGWGGLGAR